MCVCVCMYVCMYVYVLIGYHLSEGWQKEEGERNHFSMLSSHFALPCMVLSYFKVTCNVRHVKSIDYIVVCNLSVIFYKALDFLISISKYLALVTSIVLVFL